MAARLLAMDRLVLGALLALAAAVRLPGLAARGMFDADQGHDVLTLLRFTRDGVVPLVGPPTSIGDFHHGAFYYYLLAPAAAVSGADPVAIVAEIALLGIAAVGITWWLGRAIGGPLAGLVAGLLLALSPAAIDESTFIWNPNPIPFFAALALAAAWHARQTGRVRWWILAIASAGVVFQLHVLGVVFLPPVLALLATEAWGARRRGDDAVARRLIGAAAAGLAVVALLFVPLLVSELGSDFSETRHAIAYFTSSAPAPGQLGLLGRLVFTLFRIIAWPLVGLVTAEPLGATLALALTVVLALWAAIALDGDRRLAVRWLAATVAWTALALAILAPSLQTVVAGFPNDHYHAFMDPVVVVLVGVSAAGLLASGEATSVRARGLRWPLRLGLAAMLVIMVGAFGIRHWPPATDPNGGWPAAQAAGRRIVETTGRAQTWVVGVPTFKSPEAILYPIVAAGGSASTASRLVDPYEVVVCDRLFEPVVGAACGGPAEDARVGLTATGSGAALVTRFDASPRTSVSIYAFGRP
jgi:4-amino-4-deoxy-L-arabinose transferase-like glycosyltransferase